MCLLRLVLAGGSAPEVVASVCQAVAPAGDDVEAGAGGRGSACPDRAVLSVIGADGR
jgi:hypothetical protein